VERRHYVCRELAYDWRANLPDGFTLRRMDEGLLSQSGLKVPDDVKGTLEKWRSIDDPRLADFGFVAIDDAENEVASWATVDGIVDGVGDAGLFTQEHYRRRGLAAVTTGAAVEHGLSSGLSVVSWTCAESNTGSIHTAERLGFERQRDYTMYYCCFDEVQHLGALAYHHLEGKRYQDAAGLMERVLAMEEEAPCWVYYDAARVWAALGNRDRAFECLRAAVAGGWTDASGAEHCPEFEELRGTPEWAACWGL
jgi:RimJ/RimL family protein N-acetyltransferase